MYFETMKWSNNQKLNLLWILVQKMLRMTYKVGINFNTVLRLTSDNLLTQSTTAVLRALCFIILSAKYSRKLAVECWQFRGYKELQIFIELQFEKMCGHMFQFRWENYTKLLLYTAHIDCKECQTFQQTAWPWKRRNRWRNQWKNFHFFFLNIFENPVNHVLMARIVNIWYCGH